MTSKSYQLDEAAFSFTTLTTPAITLTSLATVTGRQSAQYDLTASARAYLYEWRAYVKFSTAPVVGETIDIYLKTSDGTQLDNDDGTGDIAVSSVDKLKNLHYIGSIVVDEAATAIEMSASGVCKITSRYFHVVFWNATVDTLSATAADNGISFKPFSIQGQAT